MNDKPKLTEEQAKEIEKYYLTNPKISVSEALAATGYMEKPETALEKAEAFYAEWFKSFSHDAGSTLIIKMYVAFTKAIKELQESK